MINFEQLLSQVLSTGREQGSWEVGQGNKNENSILAQAGSFLSRKSAGYGGALGVGAATGVLASVLFGSRRIRQVASTALQVGAVAAIGGLAYKAYQNYQQGHAAVRPGGSDLLASKMSGPGSELGMDAFVPPTQADAIARLLLKAMIAAAAADGHLDEHESHRIRKQLEASNLSDEEKRFLDASLSQPVRIAELVNEATTPALRMVVYMAARLAIEPDSKAEHEWLTTLATELKLDPALKAQLDAVTIPVPAEVV